MARLQMATATAGATLTGGRLPEWTNGTVSKTVVVFRITMGSNPIPSAIQSLKRHRPLLYFLALGRLVGFGFSVFA